MAQRDQTTTSDPAGRSSGRRAEVLALAADLFARNGYASTTVRDIADAAGILSGSLYHHFRSKEAIADAIVSPLLADVVERCEAVAADGADPRAGFEALAAATFEAIEHDRAAAVVYEGDRRQLAALPLLAHVAEAEARIERAWLGVLERGAAEGGFRGGLDTALAYRLIRDALWSVARWWDPADGPSRDHLTDQYLRILLDGVVRGKRKKGKKE